MWVDPGYLDKLLLWPALPAFILSAVAVAMFARFGISEVWTFMILMPLLSFAWFYFVGRMLDDLIRKLFRPS